MNIHRLLYLFGENQNPQNSFSEKRLVCKKGTEKPSKGEPSLEDTRATLEKRVKQLREQKIKERQNAGPDMTKLDPVGKIFARLNGKTYKKILKWEEFKEVGHEIFINELTIEQVETLLKFWGKNDSDNLRNLRTITAQISAGKLSLESAKIVINAFKGKNADLKKFFGRFKIYA